MWKQGIACLLAVCITMASPVLSSSQTSLGSSPPAPRGDPWPREITVPGAILQIYQPQLEGWKGNVLDAYAAVGVKNVISDKMEYGVIWFTPQTEVDKVNRLVTLLNLKISKQNFPSLANDGAAYTQALSNHLPWTQRSHWIISRVRW
jgi:hypothetical protein